MKKLIAFIALIFIFSGQAQAEKSRFEKLELFNKVLNLIETQYYRDVDIEKLIQGAIKGMMSTLDPHSAFLDEDLFSKMSEETQGEFGGLGIEVQQKDGILVIITPIDDTPAHKAGLKAGDKIVEINHESTLGWTLEEAVEKMRGPTGSKINIGIVRQGVEGIKQFVVERKIIKVTPVKAVDLGEGFLYLRLTQFQKRSAESIISEIKNYGKKKNKLKGIILDLRSNPGGLLDEAVEVSSVFLRDGVVVSTEDRDPKNKKIFYVKKTTFKELDVSMAVLINGSSASASEIVAGALQDHGRAVIMGTRSFGKGSVQTVAKIDEKNGVKLTTAQYMTANGRKIQAIGIVPDIEVEELDQSTVDSAKGSELFIREVDLRNHLSATKETDEEKKLRLENEAKERKDRIDRYKKQNQKKKQTEDKIAVKENPFEDYQITQALRLLKSFDVMKKVVQ